MRVLVCYGFAKVHGPGEYTSTPLATEMNKKGIGALMDFMYVPRGSEPSLMSIHAVVQVSRLPARYSENTYVFEAQGLPEPWKSP